MGNGPTDQAALVADLRTTNREYEAILDAVAEAVFLLDVDEDGTISYQRFNEREEEFTGKSTEEVRGKTPVEVFGDDLGRQLRANYRRCVEREETVTYEETLPSDGEATIWRTTLTPIVEDGRVRRIVGTGQEITELRDSTRELERRLSFLENTSDVVVVLDETGTAQYQNHCREHLPGPNVFDVTGSEPTERIHPDDRSVAKETFRSVLEDAGGTARNELRIEQTDGEYGWYEQRVVDLADHPAVDGVLVSSRNISERKRRERALKQLHSSTRDLMTATTAEEVADIGSKTAAQVLDQSMNGLHFYDGEADSLAPVAWTGDSERLLGGPPPSLPVDDSLAGRVYRTGTAANYADLDDRADPFDADTPFRSELVLPLGEHGVFIFSSTAVDKFDRIDETLARVLAANVETALDRVAQHRRLERQNDRLDQFASVLSHDIRNPLSVAEGHLELARSAAEGDDRHLDAIERAHTRIETLIDDLLTLAREGDEVGAVEALEVAPVVEACWAHIETERAAVTVDIDRTVRADRSRLKQLFENLFRNAVEHGGPDVTVSVGELADGFYVEDDGPGVPADEREGIFEAGYSTAESGTGLGLSIVRRIAEAHGWEVSVTDGTDGGARFEITGLEADTE
jgi:PAS domain S-box-containing protein